VTGWSITLPVRQHGTSGDFDLDADTIIKQLKLHCNRWAFQEELGEGGFHHYQIALQLKDKSRRLQFFNGHCKPTRAGDAAFKYATKEESRVIGPWTSEDPETEIAREDLQDLYFNYTEAQAHFVCWLAELAWNNREFRTRGIVKIEEPQGSQGKSYCLEKLATVTNSRGNKFYFDLQPLKSGDHLEEDAYAAFVKGNHKNATKSFFLMMDVPRVVMELHPDRVKSMFAQLERIRKCQDITDSRYSVKKVSANCVPMILVMNQVLPPEYLTQNRLWPYKWGQRCPDSWKSLTTEQLNQIASGDALPPPAGSTLRPLIALPPGTITWLQGKPSTRPKMRTEAERSAPLAPPPDLRAYALAQKGLLATSRTPSVASSTHSRAGSLASVARSVSVVSIDLTGDDDDLPAVNLVPKAVTSTAPATTTRVSRTEDLAEIQSLKAQISTLEGQLRDQSRLIAESERRNERRMDELLRAVRSEREKTAFARPRTPVLEERRRKRAWEDDGAAPADSPRRAAGRALQRETSYYAMPTSRSTGAVKSSKRPSPRVEPALRTRQLTYHEQQLEERLKERERQLEELQCRESSLLSRLGIDTAPYNELDAEDDEYGETSDMQDEVRDTESERGEDDDDDEDEEDTEFKITFG